MSDAQDREIRNADENLADDLLMDAILQGHHLDQQGSLDARVQRVMADVNAPASRLGISQRLHRQISRQLSAHRWGTAIAATLILAAGLATIMTISTTPTAVASLDQTLRLIEREDLTFRIELTKEQTAGATTIDRRFPRRERPSRRSGRSAPPIEQFDGAALHVRGPKYVLLGDRVLARGLAKGFDGETHWTNGPSEPAPRKDSGTRSPLIDQFFEFVTLDLHELIRDLRGGYDVEILGLESALTSDGVERQLVHHRANLRDASQTRLPLQIDLWTDADTGRLEAMDCHGVRFGRRDGTYEISLILENDSQLPDAWFDRQSHLPDPDRGGPRRRDHIGPGVGDPFPPPFPPPHPPKKNDDRDRRRPTQDP